MAENNNKIGGILLAFVAGAIVGAAIALLYAPQSGKETRELLAKKASELKEATAEKIEKGKEFIRKKKAELARAIEAGKEALKEERGEIEKEIERELS